MSHISSTLRGCSAADGSAAALLYCINDIDRMYSNRLKLNADKTQFIWLGSPQQLHIRHVQLTAGGVYVTRFAIRVGRPSRNCQ